MINRPLPRLLLLSIALAGGCARTTEPMPTAGPLPAGSFTHHWRSDLQPQNDYLRELHLRGDKLFVYTRRRNVYVMNRSGGQLQYVNAIQRGGKLMPPVALPEFVVIPVGSSLEVFDAKGKFLRSIDLRASIRSGAAGRNTNVYVGADQPYGGRLIAVDLAREYVLSRWELSIPGGVSAAPAMFREVVFVGGEDGKVYAADENRTSTWPMMGGTFQTGGRILADLKADEYGVYVASTDSKLYCLDRANGRVRWKYFAGATLTTSPVVTATSVYQLVPEQGLAALDKAEGPFHRTPRWIVADAVQFLSEDSKFAYLRRRDDRIVAVGRADGKVHFVSQGTLDAFATNTTDEMIYAARKSGEVFAIKPVLATGQIGEIVMELRRLELAAR